MERQPFDSRRRAIPILGRGSGFGPDRGAVSAPSVREDVPPRVGRGMSRGRSISLPWEEPAQPEVLQDYWEDPQQPHPPIGAAAEPSVEYEQPEVLRQQNVELGVPCTSIRRPASLALSRPTSRGTQPSLQQQAILSGPGISGVGYNVREYSLDQLASLMHLQDSVKRAAHDILQPRKPPQLHDSVIHVMLETIEKICIMPRFEEFSDGLILVNLPGLPEIERFTQYRESRPLLVTSKIILIPFDGNMMLEENRQPKDFIKCAGGTVPVLLATPIADSSLTIKNCSVVLDSGLTKHLELDTDTGLNVLRKFWADRSVCSQRRGRTGRDRNGLYIKFIPNDFKIMDVPTELTRTRLNDEYARIVAMSKNRLGMAVHGFLTKFLRNFLFTKPLIENINMAISALLNNGTICRNDNDLDKNNPFDGFKLTFIGHTLSHFQVEAPLIRACFMSALFGSFESVAIIVAHSSDSRVQFFKPGTESLRILHFKMRYAVEWPSDAVIMANVFRQWVKSPNTRRTDKKEKKSGPTTKLTSLPTRYADNKVNDNDLYGCNLSAFPYIDDQVHEITSGFQALNLEKTSTVNYRYAGESVADKRQATIDDKAMEMMSLVLTAPQECHFYSKPRYSNTFETLRNFCVLNSVVLEPAPPKDSDVREWGPQLMEALSKPSNVYPDVIVDHKLNRVIATFPPCSETPYLGMIHPSVKDVLHRMSICGLRNDFLIHYTKCPEGTELPDSKTVNSYSKDVRMQDHLVADKHSEEDKDTGFGMQTTFQIVEFRNPHNFGVRLLTHKFEDDFLDLSRRMVTVRESLIPLTVRKAKFGTKVIYREYMKKATDASKWNQKFWRGIVIGGLTDDNLQGTTAEQQQQMKIVVEMIDHGVTYNKRLDCLFLFEEGTCDYEIPDLFTRIPRLGYRVSLSTIQPNYNEQTTWSGIVIQAMTEELQVKENGYGSLCKLDIEFSSTYRNRIVAKDVFNPKRTKSFVSWVLRNNYAKPLQNVWVDDFKHRQQSRTFCPRPRSTATLKAYKERSQQLQNLAHAKAQSVDNFTFTNLFSHMQVIFVPVLKRSTEMQLEITAASINCAPMDHRLADPEMTESVYDPMLAIASELTVGRVERMKTFFSPNTTILHPYTGVVPLVQMLVHPLVEIISIKKYGPVAAVYYNLDHSGNFQEATNILFKARIWREDLALVEQLRNVINLVHINGKTLQHLPSFRNDMLKLMKSYRISRFLDMPQYSSTIKGTPFTGEGILVPQLLKTTLEPTNFASME